MSLRDELEMKYLLYGLRHSTADIRLFPDIFTFQLLNHSISEVAGFPVIDLSVTPMVGMNQLAKTLLDMTLTPILLIFVAPLMLLIACGVKLSSQGPVLFRQNRLGMDGKEFAVFKFRTMVLHKEMPGVVVQATKNDVRVTPFGLFLRRSSLDELPQLFNVLRGEMSLVGPRPHAIEHNELYKNAVQGYMLRHKVKPGMTGWAQVNGWRGESDTLEKMQKRVECDLYYIENWSIFFDLWIMVLTALKGLRHSNAY
jgi:putative colanic acid biosynthesis UDP-glucose lipid carrier transferase